MFVKYIRSFQIIDELIVVTNSFSTNFQYVFRFFRLTADPLLIVAGRISRAFDMAGVTEAVVLDIS